MRQIQSDDEDLVLLLVRTGKAVVDRLRAEHPDPSSGPLTVVHGLAAHYLRGRDDVTTVELARHLGITKQSASEVVAALEHEGMVRRAPHPTDGRARVLLLTKQGLAKLADARRRRKRIEDEWIAIVGEEQLDVVRHALTAYLDAATSPDVTARSTPRGQACRVPVQDASVGHNTRS